jgi:predicted nucleotidyltransferase
MASPGGLNMPKMGINIPLMGKLTASRSRLSRRRRSAPSRRSQERLTVADALFTTTQQRVLGFLYGQPERSFFASELIALAGSGSGAVQRELTRLVESGLIMSRPVGKQRHYQANPAAPIYEELRSIIVKTAGLAEPLRIALKSLAPRITLALLYGSVARGTATSASDVDVLIVADDLVLEDLYSALSRAEKRLARKINPTLYTVDEFQRRRKQGNSFVSRVIAGSHVLLIGDLRALETAR